ncbi:MAG: hypothetical protein SFV81_19055 [Pirellulaceae bacterium]|nr:hypothetical protein [Pirellulaceae bacterium]
MKLTVMKCLLGSAALVAAVPTAGQEARSQEPGNPSAVRQQAELSPPPSTPPQAAELKLSPNDASTDQFEVLMSGPIHEAFAEPFVQADAQTLVVTKTPPEPIDELPPDVQPAGDNIEWIPGYWGWDQRQDDFVWVTGLWRQSPPERQWVPGYWNQVEDGYQWISGFWAEQIAEEIAYLPAPPAALEAVPSTPQPGENYFWVPGQWNYANNQYQWQAGYWAQHNPDWIWINTAYLATPQGYVCRPGYWDYQLGYRGTIFYPVRFNSGYAGNYRPNYVMNVGTNWLANLFVNPGYRHYYFGNYYDTQYQQNFYPWVNYSQRQRNYDPLYSYYQAGHQNYITQINQVHLQYQQNQQFRPAATFRAQQKQERELDAGNASFAFNSAAIGALAVEGQRLRRSSDNPALSDSHEAFQYRKLDRDATNKVVNALKPVKELQQQRRNIERTKPAPVGNLLREPNTKDGKNPAKDNRVVDGPKKNGTGAAGAGTGGAGTGLGKEVVRGIQPPRDTGPSTSLKTDPAIKLKLPRGSAGRAQPAPGSQGKVQTPTKDNGPTGKAGEPGKGRSNVDASGGQGRRNADPGVKAQPQGAGNPAMRIEPPRAAAPSLPPVPHSPSGAGRGGGVSPRGEAKPKGEAKPNGEAKPKGNPKPEGKPNGGRGDKK